MRNFTVKELEQSANAPKFSQVTAKQLFSKNADAGLANRVRMQNRLRYQELKQEWLWQTGQERRPDSHYGE
jgi:hypothetical protein